MTNDELHQRFRQLRAQINTIASFQGQRIARLERQRAAEQGEEVSVRVVKTVDFRLRLTVAEMAEYFEVNPGAIRANQGNYARKMADSTVTDFMRDEPGWWPKAITRVVILSTDVVKVER